MPENPIPQSRFLALVPLACLLAGPSAVLAQTLYNFGNPNADEQLYIELINRARANPPAEGVRLATTTDPSVTAAYAQFGVDLTVLQNEFNAIAATPPLAPSEALTSAARSHSLWMLNNSTQSHNETNPTNDPGSRITAAGYNWSTYGENVYAYSTSTWYGHAGFEVDWGTGGTYGMQNPRGHRNSIHNSSFREIGVGVQLGSNGAVGPQLVTQDFGRQSADPSFGTGVSYYDLNSNSFYDAGEGISGLTVNVSGTTTYCLTATGGGWTVPIPTSAATRTVTFSGLGMNRTASLVVPASKNAKVDLKLTYSPPAITSAATATAGSAHNLTFSAIEGCTGYHWNRWNTTAAAAENCESLTNTTVTKSGTYNVLSTSVKQQGTASFHLEHSTGGSQILELNGSYYGMTNPSLAFQSSVRYSTTSEHFKIQLREDSSSVWQNVYDQQGYGSSGESGFNARSAALTGMAGKSFHVRFVLEFISGSYYPNSGDGFGWFIDTISFTNVSSLTNNTIQTLAANSGSFTPSAGTYLMSVAPIISGNDFPASYQTLTVASQPTPSFTTWAGTMETSNSLPAGTISNYPNADQDKDGRCNLIEYAFGTSPVMPNDPAPRMPVTVTDPTYYILQYQRDTSLTDLTFTVCASSDLTTWKTPGQSGAPAGFTDTLVSTAGTIETRRAKIPVSSGGKWFMNVRVNKP
ncbi:MAG: CAP domain-containing protein [Luteolibacter sp.]